MGNKLGTKFQETIERIAKQVNDAWEKKYPEGRALDRIESILLRIEYIWKRNPQLRMCQLIQNCFTQSDIYFVEDGDLYDRLAEVYLDGNESECDSTED